MSNTDLTFDYRDGKYYCRVCGIAVEAGSFEEARLEHNLQSDLKAHTKVLVVDDTFEMAKALSEALKDMEGTINQQGHIGGEDISLIALEHNLSVDEIMDEETKRNRRMSRRHRKQKQQRRRR